VRLCEAMWYVLVSCFSEAPSIQYTTRLKKLVAIDCNWKTLMTGRNMVCVSVYATSDYWEKNVDAICAPSQLYSHREDST